MEREQPTATTMRGCSVPALRSAAAKAAASAAAKKKRKRKIIYPKDFDPKAANNPVPDPERWLPKYERAEYKKRMAKKNKGLFRGPQGVGSVTEGQAGANDGVAGQKKAGPSTANAAVTSEYAGRKKKK